MLLFNLAFLGGVLFTSQMRLQVYYNLKPEVFEKIEGYNLSKDQLVWKLSDWIFVYFSRLEFEMSLKGQCRGFEMSLKGEVKKIHHVFFPMVSGQGVSVFWSHHLQNRAHPSCGVGPYVQNLQFFNVFITRQAHLPLKVRKQANLRRSVKKIACGNLITVYAICLALRVTNTVQDEGQIVFLSTLRFLS